MASPQPPNMPRRPSGGVPPDAPLVAGVGHPAFNALAEPHQAGTYWANVFAPAPTETDPALPRPLAYNRLSSNTSAR